MSERGLRARTVLDRRFGVVLAALLVLAAVGGWVSYGAHVDPGTHTEPRTTDEWRVEGEFTHRAAVTAAAEGTPFEPGTVVRDRQLYFERVMPVLAGEFRLSYPRGSDPITVDVRQELVVRSAGVDSRTVYWQETRPLGTNEATLSPGDQVAVPFEFNVSRTNERASAVDDRLGAPGTLQTRVRANVTLTRGETTRTESFLLPVVAEGGVYRPQAEPRAETFSRTETITVRNEIGPLRTYGGPLALLVGLLGAGALALARRRGAITLSDAERAWLDYRDDRVDFDEWITTIRLPEEAASLPAAEAATLADLVDFAIDTDNAVLESPDGDAYHVVHDGYRYTFEAPPEPAASGPLGIGLDDGTTGSDDATDDANATLLDVPGLDRTAAARLRELGIETPTALADADPDAVADGLGTDAERAATLVEQAGEAVADGGPDGGSVAAVPDTPPDDPLTDIRGVGELYSEELRAVGIETPAELAEAEPIAVAAATNISQGWIETLIERADEAAAGEPPGVEVVEGVDADTGRVLREAGVETLAELATADARELAERTDRSPDDLAALVERAGAELDARLRE
jgi:predicted flap endonuclease-1-like 5' DNA nuclease